MSDTTFEEAFIDALELIDLDEFALDEDDFESFEEMYQFIENCAMEQQLLNTAVALPLVRAIMSREALTPTEDEDGSEYVEDYQHCLSVTRMLIDLHLPLTHDEMDILLASAICHVLPANLPDFIAQKRLVNEYHLHPEIQRIVALLHARGDMSPTAQKKYYGRIQRNPLALLIALAGRGDMISQLHEVSSWSARRYIYQTRSCYFPMSIYAREHYPSLLAPISVLTEKLRCLIEISEILLGRYEIREIELTQEILSLKEENAKLKGLIQKHRS